MAQIFKSKELTFAVPEKESGEQLARRGITNTTPFCQPHCTCTWDSIPCIFSYACNITIYSPVYYCTLGTRPIPIPNCTGTETPWILVENEISEITDIETLRILNQSLLSSLEEVKARQAELSKTK